MSVTASEPNLAGLIPGWWNLKGISKDQDSSIMVMGFIKVMGRSLVKQEETFVCITDIKTGATPTSFCNIQADNFW